jgi:hypothetical protein
MLFGGSIGGAEVFGGEKNEMVAPKVTDERRPCGKLLREALQFGAIDDGRVVINGHGFNARNKALMVVASW